MNILSDRIVMRQHLMKPQESRGRRGGDPGKVRHLPAATDSYQRSLATNPGELTSNHEAEEVAAPTQELSHESWDIVTSSQERT